MKDLLFNRKGITVLVMMLFVMSVCIMFSARPAYAVSDTRIGQATCGEGGKMVGGQPGDQTGSEVAESDWGYGSSSGSPYHWVYVFRAKDPLTGKKLAENMKAACANNHIGYDRHSPDRETLYDCAKANNWDIATITTNCETTCVDVVSVCCNAAGISTPRSWASVNVYSDLMATGMFDVFTSSDYTASSANLLPGDILCNPNAPHTAMVIDSVNSFYFDVTYQDEEGESQTIQVEDGSEIVLNPNNGTSPVPITIEEPTDLSSYDPGKGGAVFKGWEKNEDDTFTADYELAMRAIRTENNKKTIEGEDTEGEHQLPMLSIKTDNKKRKIRD